VPVLVVKPGKRGRFQRVAVAVDPGTTEAPQTALNRRLLELGAEVAERDAAELHVVHAWQLLAEAMRRGRGGPHSSPCCVRMPVCIHIFIC
jgi:universal stress protein E